MVPSLAAVRSRLYRIALSYFPAFRSTGGRVTDLAPDFPYARVKLPLNWRTRNGLGTTFGGSMYGVVDPVYVVLLTRRLGDGYVVWDEAAEIRFREPGRSTLYAEFHLPDGEIREIRRSLAPGESCDRVYDVDLVDADGTVHAEIEKTVYVRRDE